MSDRAAGIAARDDRPPWPEALQQRLAQVKTLPPDAILPSPCISVCTMNPASGLCRGCLRTLDEIAAWSLMADEDKRTVWKLIEQRASRITP